MTAAYSLGAALVVLVAVGSARAQPPEDPVLSGPIPAPHRADTPALAPVPQPPGPSSPELAPIPSPPGAGDAPAAASDLRPVPPAPPRAYGGGTYRMQRPASGTGAPLSIRACWDPRDFPEGHVRAPEALPAERCEPSLPEWIELYILAGILGAGGGAILGAELDGTDGPIGALLGTIGMTAGVLAAYAVQEAEPLSGTPAAMSTGMLIGFFGTGMAFAALNDGIDPDADLGARLAWGGALVGAGLGALVGFGLEPTRGDVAFVRSGAMWGGLLGGTAALLLDTPDPEDVGLLMLGGLTLGAAATALAAGAAEMTPARTLALDAGALVGAFGGMTMARVGSGPGGPSSQAIGAGLAVGTGAGLVIAWVLSEPIVAGTPEAPAGLRILARPANGGAWFGARGQF